MVIIIKLYYLNSNTGYWTMTPAKLRIATLFALEFVVSADSLLSEWAPSTSNYDVRPVINLKADIKISSGDGTSLSPYVIAS